VSKTITTGDIIQILRGWNNFKQEVSRLQIHDGVLYVECPVEVEVLRKGTVTRHMTTRTVKYERGHDEWGGDAWVSSVAVPHETILTTAFEGGAK